MVIGIVTVLLSSAAVFTPAQNKTAKTPQSLRPVSKLALDARLLWPALFPGDPLTIRIRIDSPLARQNAYLAQRGQETRVASKTAAFQAPGIDDSWASKVAIAVLAVQKDGSFKPILENLDWAAFLVPSPTETRGPGSLGTRPRDWTIAPEQAVLVDGEYLLRVSWKGKGLTDDALLKPDGTLDAPEFRFVVKMPADADEKIEHARRLALFEFGRQDYGKALIQAKAVINADPPFSYEVGEIYLVAAASQAAKNDFRAARDTYKTLLQWLPAEGNYTDLVKNMLAYVEAQLAQPKPKK